MEEASHGQKQAVKAFIPPLPYPQRFNKEIKDQHFPKFFEVFKKLDINIPLAKALEQMPLYAKFLKELINKKRSWHEKETVLLTEECSAVIQRGIPPKLKDLGSFIVSCTIGKMTLEKALCNLGASINLMPLSMMRKLAIEEIKPTRMSLVMADRSIKTPNGVVKNLLVKVGEFIFPADFVILDTKEEVNNSIILGRSFLSIARAIIDVEKGEMIVRVHNEQMVINVFNLMQHLPEQESYMRVDMIEGLVEEMLEANYQEQQEEEREGVQEVMEEQVAEISIEEKVEQDKTEEMPKQELKPLPTHLKYAFLGGVETLPVIINSFLSIEEEIKPVEILKAHKTALGWTIGDINGISPAIFMHKILLEEDSRPIVHHQRRLNPTMKEVVQKKVMKLWNAGIIYPIFDSSWVSPVQMVPKKGGMIVISNEKNESIPTRTVTGWRMCINYRRLNEATRKYHFPLPFIDHMLERLVGHAYYCFLDRYSRVPEGIVLGHKVSSKGIEVDRAKIEVIEKLPVPVNVKAMRSFLGHAGDVAIGAILGQKKDKLHHVIYYASKVLNEAQKNYTTTEKELLAIVYAFDKFRQYLIGSKVIVYTDHVVLKYFMSKQDPKPRLIRRVLLLQEFDIEV
ncbi:uncharacterized protein LOC130949629 [Arachis stenosperma]|uniref:uncharacterized protein LOC130949629 n=1 Tax=Arachis stenosperma TaxID=217475 RepID=UPI0025ABE23D|nr:uncharacterized protein LOC130949629 [Arachis stenosperma]